MRVLDGRQEALLGRERRLLGRLVDFLVGFGAPGEDVEIARRALADLEELFLLVIVGEFNSGKSAFVNALLGAEVSKEGVTPTTDRITLLRHANEAGERERRDGVLERTHPNDFLREVAIVDTPGTNAIIRHHEELSRNFVPRSDLVVFVTSADRPLTESERGYLELVRDWGKKVLLVVNKADLLDDEEKVEQVRTFVADGLRTALGLSPPIFFVSSMLARRAKAASSAMERDALLRASGFAALESFVHDMLDEEGRVRLKLESPLGPVGGLTRRYGETVGERLGLLEDDFRTSENVENQLSLYRDDMERDFEARLAEIENIVLRMGERGDAWLEENIRLMNVRELFREERVRRRFVREVLADTEDLIDDRVDELVDWMVERNYRQWRTVVEYVERRRRARPEGEVMGEINDHFEHDRGKILRSVAASAQGVVGGYDRERESEVLAASIQNAVARTAAIEAGALGIGAVIVALATTRFLDATGVIAAAIIAGYGLFVLPNRRRKARQDFREKTDVLRRRLGEVIRRQFESELNRSVERMREAISPYTRFVRIEHARMIRARGDLAEIEREMEALMREIAVPVSRPEN